MECENATTHRPVILHAKYGCSSSPGTKNGPRLCSPFRLAAFTCVFLGGSCVYGVLNDYPCYFRSKKEEEIKSLLVVWVVRLSW